NGSRPRRLAALAATIATRTTDIPLPRGGRAETARRAGLTAGQPQGLLAALGLVVLMRPQDAVFQHVRRLEGHDATRQDRHFLAGLRIAANALVLRTHVER